MDVDTKVKRTKKKLHLHISNNWLYFFFVMFILLLILFVIKPSIVGYTAYQQIEDSNYSIKEYGKNVNNLEQVVSTLKSNLTFQSYLVVKFTNMYTDALKEFNQCTAGKAGCETVTENQLQKIDELEESINELNCFFD